MAEPLAPNLDLRLSALLEAVSEAVLMVGPDGRVERLNRAMLILLGWPDEPDAYRGSPVEPALATLSALVYEGGFFLNRVAAIISEEAPVDDERIALRDGRLLSRSYRPSPDGGGFWLHRDVSQEVDALKVAATSHRAREGAERGDGQAAFFAVMSHEIRTPLNAIVGMAELAVDASTSPSERDQALRIIRRSGESLLELAEDVLDVSRIEAGALEITDEPFAVRQVVEEVRALFAASAEAACLELGVLVDDAVPATVRGDPARLRQVLVNLVGNAIKFTDIGGVSLRVAETVDPAWAEPGLLLQVQDTGLGIPPEELASVFRRFHRLPGSSPRGRPGSGLGLAISKSLVEAMGGAIEVKSEVGLGTTFSVRLPLPAARPSILVSAGYRRPAQALHGRVLVVDDDDDARLVTKRFLERLGMTVATANDGLRAVGRTASDRFDVVLMDLEMPRLDGIEATRQIRAAEVATSRARVPIVALTAQDSPALRAACGAAGMDAYLTKPVRKTALVGSLAPLLASGTVLIVEDSPDLRLLFRRHLERHGWVVREAGSGAEAVESFDTGTQLALIDLGLPDRDGLEVAESLRDMGFDGPILAVTGERGSAMRMRCLRGPFDGVLEKPLRKAELLAAVASFAPAQRRDLPGVPTT